MEYIVFIDTVEIQGQIFWEGVCFVYEYDEFNNLYIIEYDEVEYHVEPRYVIKTSRATRFENISFNAYATNKRMDKTTDYFKTVEKVMNIDMKVNYAPQFRDGKNPFKDGSKRKEVNNQ